MTPPPITVYALVAKSTESWAVAHNNAVMDYVAARMQPAPKHDFEQAILRLADAVAWYVNAYLRDNESPFDYVLGPYLGRVLGSIIGLLNGDVGRLDAGTVDSWCRDVAERIGWDMDIEEMK